MKALFVHSTRLVRAPDGRVYSRSAFPYRAWARYREHFPHLTVAARMADGSVVSEQWDVSSGHGVQFAGLPDDHGRWWHQARAGAATDILDREVAAADAIIVRQSRHGWIAARLAQRQGKPWAVEVVGDAWRAYWNHGHWLAKLYAPVAAWQTRRWIAQAPFALYVTSRYLQGLYPCGGHAEHTSNVDFPGGAEHVLRERISRSSTGGFAASSPQAGMIGSLNTRYKGLAVALQALRRLRKKGFPVRLRVLGAGNLEAWRTEAKALGVDDLLELDGTLPSGEPVFQWLDRLDFYMQPSFQEGLPRALIEAMSRGLPALASSCGGIPELLPPDCLHRPGDERKLAADMERMIRDAEWRAAQPPRNFETARDYCAEALEKRRHAFWARFADFARARRPGEGRY